MRRHLIALTIPVPAFALLLTALLSARQDTAGMDQHNVQSVSAGRSTSMSQMMKQCRQQCQAGSAAMDQMTEMMSKLRQNASDPAKVRTDLDEMQKQMKSIRGNMTMCMSMMNMRGAMIVFSGGGIGHMMCGRNKTQTQESMPRGANNQ